AARARGQAHQLVDVDAGQLAHLRHLLETGNLAQKTGRRANLHHHLAHHSELVDELLDLVLLAPRSIGDPPNALRRELERAPLLGLAAADELAPADRDEALRITPLLHGHRADHRLDLLELAIVELNAFGHAIRKERHLVEDVLQAAHLLDDADLL